MRLQLSRRKHKASNFYCENFPQTTTKFDKCGTYSCDFIFLLFIIAGIRSMGQGSVFTRVYPSVHMGGVCHGQAEPRRQTTPRRQTPPPPQKADPPHQDTDKRRSVRILLEYIPSLSVCLSMFEYIGPFVELFCFFF